MERYNYTWNCTSDYLLNDPSTHRCEHRTSQHGCTCLNACPVHLGEHVRGMIPPNHGIVTVGKDLQGHPSSRSVCARGCLEELRGQAMPRMKGCAFRNACRLRGASNFLSFQSSKIPGGARRPVHAAGSSVSSPSWSQGMCSCLQSSISVIQQPRSTSKQAL